MTKRPALFLAACALTLVRLSATGVADQPPGDHAAHAAHHGAPDKTPANKNEPAPKFISKGDQPKTVKLDIIATYDDTNHGMNFNGFSHGKARYTIPLGWTVEVRFINRSAVPHSAVIVEEEKISLPQVGAPYFEGAATKDYDKATAEKTGQFTFVADEAGDFAFACGFPAHSASGQWVALKISKGAELPSLTLPDGTEVKAE